MTRNSSRISAPRFCCSRSVCLIITSVCCCGQRAQGALPATLLGIHLQQASIFGRGNPAALPRPSAERRSPAGFKADPGEIADALTMWVAGSTAPDSGPPGTARGQTRAYQCSCEGCQQQGQTDHPRTTCGFRNMNMVTVVMLSCPSVQPSLPVR